MTTSLAFSNVKLDKKKAYLLYIGPFKQHGICSFYSKVLKRRYKKDMDFIYIFPHFPPHTFKGQHIVINDRIAAHMKKYKKKCYFGMSSSHQQIHISESIHVKRIVKRILAQQKDLYVHALKNTQKLKLGVNVHFIGPKPKLFEALRNKLTQHQLADLIGVPQPRWYVAANKKELEKLHRKYFKSGKAFVTKLHSAGGQGCAMVWDANELHNHPHLNLECARYIITKLVQVVQSPASEAIVANEKEVFYHGATDQILKNTKYRGNLYPSVLPASIQKQIEQYTMKIGRYLGKIGYRGSFSVDFTVDEAGHLYFSEINPRPGGGTLDWVYMHECTKARGVPSLPELMLRATLRGTFGALKVRRIRKANFAWGVLNVNTKEGTVTRADLHPACREFEAFVEQRTTILDYPGKGMLYCKAGRLCRIVSVHKTRTRVERDLHRAEHLIRGYTKASHKS